MVYRPRGPYDQPPRMIEDEYDDEFYDDSVEDLPEDRLIDALRTIELCRDRLYSYRGGTVCYRTYRPWRAEEMG